MSTSKPPAGRAAVAAPVDTGVDPAGKYDAVGAEFGVGEDRFKAIRAVWAKSRPRPTGTAASPPAASVGTTAPNLDVAAICEVLQSNKMLPLPSRVPLIEVIDILVELWEDEGLFD